MKSAIPPNVKKLVLRGLCSPKIGALVKFLGLKRTMLGGYYDYSLVDDASAARIFVASWEAAETRFSKRFAGDGPIIELGSSVGVTLGLLRSKRTNDYIGVEGSPRNFALLQKLAAQLPAPEKITLLSKAICYSGEPVVPFSETCYIGSRIGSTGVPVETIRLSDIVAQYVGAKSYTLIADIEGAEAEVFLHDSEALKNCVRIICELETTPIATIQQQIDAVLAMGFVSIEHYGNFHVFGRPSRPS